MTLIILLISTVGLMLEGIAIVSYEVRSYRLQMTQDLLTLAQIAGDQNTAVLAFDDPNTARDNLAALQGKSEIMMAGFIRPTKSFSRATTAPISKNSLCRPLHQPQITISRKATSKYRARLFITTKLSARSTSAPI
jgi:hypothetical protein